jgi:hypothetical protein
MKKIITLFASLFVFIIITITDFKNAKFTTNILKISLINMIVFVMDKDLALCGIRIEASYIN